MQRGGHNKTSAAKEAEVVSLYLQMYRPAHISEMAGVGMSSINKILKRNGIERTGKTAAARILTHKRCNACLELKSVSEFAKAQKHVKHHVVQATCKPCTAKVSNQWSAKNIEKRRLYNRNWAAKKSASSIQFRIAQNMRRRVRWAVASAKAHKAGKFHDLLGCSMMEFMRHMEAGFVPGMSWENYGQWHVDHKVPCDSFDLSEEENQRKCFHYSNLQPLWAIDNMRKGNKVEAR